MRRSEILRRIESYGLIFLERLENGLTTGFGTGTLVRYSNHFGIVTARHVLEAVVEKGRSVLYAPTVGVITRNEARESGYPLPQARQPWWYRQDGAICSIKAEEKVLKGDGEIISVALTGRDACRPDLGVMMVSERMRSNLASTSSFYDLETGMKHHADASGGKELLYVDPENSQGCYVIMGVLGRRQRYSVDSVDPSGETVSQPMLWCLQSTAGKKYSRRAGNHVYDYRNFLATDEAGNPDVESGLGSWAGMSGSGVWEVVGQLVDDRCGGTTVEDRVTFSGVAFAEEWIRVQPERGPPDVIYCHSDRSIYPRVIEMLTRGV